MSSKENSKPSTFQLKAYTPKEMRAFYGLSQRSFKTWLDPHREQLGPLQGRYYTIKQVQFIIDQFGVPGFIEI